MVTLFAVFGEVETNGFRLGGHSKRSQHGLHEVNNEHRRSDGPDEHQTSRFQLLQPESFSDEGFDAVRSKVWVRVRRREDPRKDRPQRSANGVDAEPPVRTFVMGAKEWRTGATWSCRAGSWWRSAGRSACPT